MALAYREECSHVANKAAGLQGFIDRANESTLLLVAREKELEELKRCTDFARVEDLEGKLAASEGALKDMTLQRDAEAQVVGELKKRTDGLAAEKEELVKRCEDLQQLLAQEKTSSERLLLESTKSVDALKTLEVEKVARDAEIEKLRTDLEEAEKLVLDASTFGFERCQKQIARRFPNHGLDLTALDPYELEEESEPEQ
jgi:chromosome segregation ATPase